MNSPGKPGLPAFMSKMFLPFSGIHESLYCIIAIGLETTAGLSLPFVKSLNEYYGIQVLTIVQYGVWANARTLITFCIESNEIGKVYASVGIGKERSCLKKIELLHMLLICHLYGIRKPPSFYLILCYLMYLYYFPPNKCSIFCCNRPRYIID